MATDLPLIQAAAWNRDHSIGAPVYYRDDCGKTHATETRSEAYVLSGHTAVILISGRVGCVALDRVMVRAMTDSARIAAIAEGLANATPGEWEVEPGLGRGYVPADDGVRSKLRNDKGWPVLWLFHSPGISLTPEDATFIANAPSDIAFLLARIAALEKELELQPMTSAPRDGTPILLAVDRFGVHRVEWTKSVNGNEGWCVDDQKHGPYSLRGYSKELGWLPLPTAPHQRREPPARPIQREANKGCSAGRGGEGGRQARGGGAMSAQDWAKSRMYRRGYEDGRAQGRAEASYAVIRIHMADGKVLLCQDVIDELARAGWKLCLIDPPSPQLKLVEAEHG